jgi:hypothetical protein
MVEGKSARVPGTNFGNTFQITQSDSPHFVERLDGVFVFVIHVEFRTERPVNFYRIFVPTFRVLSGTYGTACRVYVGGVPRQYLQYRNGLPVGTSSLCTN